MDLSQRKIAVVLLGHGSLNPETALESQQLGSQLHGNRPNWTFVSAYLNQEPGLKTVVEELRAKDQDWIYVLPLLVFKGKHIEIDIPALLKQLNLEKTRKPMPPITLLSHLSQLPGFSDFLIHGMHIEMSKEQE